MGQRLVLERGGQITTSADNQGAGCCDHSGL